MSGHVSDDRITELASMSEGVSDPHVATCAVCRTKVKRLRGGLALVALAKNDEPRMPDWSRVDAVIQRAAIDAAQKAPVLRRNAQRNRVVSMTVGVSLAAAAAGVLVFRSANAPTASTAPTPPVAQTVVDAGVVAPVAVQQPPAVVRPPTVQTPAPVVASLDRPTVLLVAGHVDFVSNSGERSSLTASSDLAKGGGIEAAARSRAVVALQTGIRLDTRERSRVHIDALAPQAATVSIEEGEARVDGIASRSVEVKVPGWVLSAKGGAFLTRVEHDVVRLKVVRGDLDVRGSDGLHKASQGQEIELSRKGSAFAVRATNAVDNDALDLAFEDAASEPSRIPAPPFAGNSVRWSLESDGRVTALPPNTTLVAAGTGSRVVVRSGSDRAVLALRGQGASWREARRDELEQTPRGAVHVATATPPASPTTIPEDPPIAAGLEPREQVHASIVRIAHRCLRECTATGTCGTQNSGWVAIDPNSDGTVSAARATGFDSDQTRACIERGAHALRIPTSLGIRTQQWWVR